ncbi:hypothetical protein MHSWG343_05570 [Candidatus Mycoplasma haematohominis]|uniref:Uncharacterized protein n=1 Tax=Candidatus Mycoplasma haematohominis TaxID=1494318 RepID=A0A478FU49_9MOLU|nr:hypothetical protein MHSWG343_05570 [Candidatus Mycoplasma haemohominis]
MSAAIKGAVALGATAVVVGGTGVGAKFLLDAQEPNCVRLKTPQSGKYGEDYKRYFVDDTDENNDKWWNWVFKNRYEKDKQDSSQNKHTALTKFEDLKSGSEKENSLKKVCGDAYKETNGGSGNIVSKSSVGNDGSKYSEDDIWRYCSIFGNKPKTLKEVNEADSSRTVNTFAKTKEEELIDTSYEGNEKFWEEQNRYFFGLKETDLNDVKTLFMDLFKNKNDTVKNTCAKGYLKTTSDANEVAVEDLLKFCSLKGK